MAAGSSSVTHWYQLCHAIDAASRVGIRGGASRCRTSRTWLQGNNTGEENEKELHAAVVVLVVVLLQPHPTVRRSSTSGGSEKKERR
ncbi:hypothetical protein TRIUR3_21268 [Triticum urartu]|uniref:Uncharacterized protein n=1 Tax=Triticum urartu TaxID=4572 RepID=M8ANV0_TRIUA|nr:hypothetical protein TRIUR3_21268 [Triticum urartu]